MPTPFPPGGTNTQSFANGCVVVGVSADGINWTWTITPGPEGAMPPGYVANDPRWPGATVEGT